MSIVAIVVPVKVVMSIVAIVVPVKVVVAVAMMIVESTTMLIEVVLPVIVVSLNVV